MYLENRTKKTGAFEKQGRSLKKFTFKIGTVAAVENSDTLTTPNF
jgi:hypothetical protein